MSGGKETPRQKMVGLMYLVLMALLAMNVSKDILEAFVTVNSGLLNTTENFEKKNDDLIHPSLWKTNRSKVIVDE